MTDRDRERQAEDRDRSRQTERDRDRVRQIETDRQRQRRELVFLQVQKATLGTGDMCLQAWFVLQGPSVLAFVVLPFWAGWARLG